jgi:cytochrome P450
MSSQPLVAAVPGPGIGAIPRTLRDFPSNPIQYCSDLFRQYGDFVRFRVGPYAVYMLVHPDFVKHVLQDNNRNYSKGKFYDAFKPVVGDGLLTSEGDTWRHQRRIANPSFQHAHIHGFVSMFAQQSRSLLEQWATPAHDQTPIDLPREMMRLTFGVVGQALFSMDLEKEAREVGNAITVALAESSRRADMLMGLPLWLPTASNARYKKALQTLNTSVFQIIQERRAMRDRPVDLLTMLIEAVDEETGDSMSDQELRDEVMTFMLAGHETTANALTWTWFLLSEHPDAEHRVRAECRQVVGERLPTFADLEHLTYTKMVFQESMRLYPPIPFIARTALQSDQIGGYTIPSNSAVLLSQYLTHRHPAFWDHPETFDPERFTPAAIEKRPELCYFPFSRGQRMCIGEDFATLEAQVFLCMAVQKYSLHRVSTEPVELLEQVTLRPKGGMLMRVTSAQAARSAQLT